MLPTTLESVSPDLAIGHFVLLFVAGALAAAVNTVAGGGSLISFPVLIAMGVPPIVANATNTFALTLGGITGALGYLPSLRLSSLRLAVLVKCMVPIALFGGFVGACLLLHTNEQVFRLLVPVLLLAATVLLALRSARPSRSVTAAPLYAAQGGMAAIFAISVYGGYFGACMGIVFLAALNMFIPGDVHNHNAIKNWLQCVVNVIAAAVFLTQGMVLILPGLALMAGGVVGGYVSATLSQKLNPKVLRMAIVAYSAVATIWFIAKAF
jgi:uncharacterized membrane protein YfcA